MTTFQSTVRNMGTVSTFPAFTNERVYMRPFRKQDGLPSDLARWQGVVNEMLNGVDSDGPIYLMVDQARVERNQFHRRSGLHIDGYWCGSGHGAGRHKGEPPPQRHEPAPRHAPAHSSGSTRWEDATFDRPEGIILVSNVAGCRAMAGQFKGPIRQGGDCAHGDFNQCRSILMKPNQVYAGNVTMVHETLPVEQACERTVVRLNVPGWHP